VVLWAAALAALVWLLVASLGPAPSLIDAFRFADKVFHALHYALTTILFLLAAVWRPGRGAGPAPRAAKAIVVTGLILGAAIEVIQGFIGRQADLVDFLADAAGIALGLGSWAGLRAVGTRSRRPSV
jgi:VanZ family protein